MSPARSRALRLALAATVAIPWMPAAAGGDTFVVTKTDDTSDRVCNVEDCSLREAVIAANDNPGHDLIEVPAGDYVLTRVGADEDLASTGDLDLTDDVTIRATGRGLASVSGGGIDRVFQLHLGVAARLERLVIRDGVAVSATSACGGGIESGGDLDLWRMAIVENRANRGGGICASIGTLTVSESSLAANEAEDLGFLNADGGGIETGVVTTISRSTLNGNRAARFGSALWSQPAGGASGVTIENSTISDNLGGEAVSLENVNATLVHVTIADNQGVGLGAYSFQSGHVLTWTQSIAADNGGSDCDYGLSPPVIVPTGRNLSSDASCGFVPPEDLVNVDPVLGPLQDNGGSTATRLLLPTSPALDAGVNPACAAIDQRGRPRPADGDGDGSADCDIGAVEVPEPGPGALGLATLLGFALLAGSRRARLAHERSVRPTPLRRWLALAPVLGALLLAGSVQAATFTVDTTADGVDLSPGDGICAASAGCTLRAAVQEANALSGADKVVLGTGVYALTRPGAGEDLAATGDLDVTGDLDIVGVGAAASIIDGGALDRVLDLREGTLSLEHLTVRNGRISGENGAGIRTGPLSSSLSLLGSRVTENHAVGSSLTEDAGGGIFAECGVTLAQSTVSGNAARESGGVAFTFGGSIVDSTLAGNHAEIDAGGFSVSFLQGVTVERSTISGNTVGVEGNASAIRQWGPVRMTNSTVSGNSGGLLGAGGVIVLSDTELLLENTTVYGNDSEGGILLFNGTVQAINAILWNEIAASHDECEGTGTVTSEGYNIDSDGTCVGAGPGDQPGVDPRLRALADNGGPTRTHLPLPGSPVIDHGGAGILGCTDLDGTPVTEDQRGETRPVDGDGDTLPKCDIGSVEYAPEPAGLPAVAAVLAALRLAAAGRRRLAG